MLLRIRDLALGRLRVAVPRGHKVRHLPIRLRHETQRGQNTGAQPRGESRHVGRGQLDGLGSVEQRTCCIDLGQPGLEARQSGRGLPPQLVLTRLELGLRRRQLRIGLVHHSLLARLGLGLLAV